MSKILIITAFLFGLLINFPAYSLEHSSVSNIFTLDTRDTTSCIPVQHSAVSNIFTLDTRDSTTDRTLIITEVSAAAGANVVVPINITDASGIAGADLDITYDPNILTTKKVEKTTLTNDFSISPNTNISGRIIIAMANPNAIQSGSGAIVNMTFTVKAGLSSGTETPVSFRDASIYDVNGLSIPVGTQNGKVKIGVDCTKGDVNNDGRINSADAILALRIASGLLVPTEQQKCAADFNNDNRVNSADAILILRKASGLAPDRESIITDGRIVNLTLKEVYGKSGDIITVPIKIDNSDIIAGGDISLSYNGAVLRAIEVLSMNDLLLAGNVAEFGSIRIAFAGEGTINSDVLFSIKFQVLADDISPLTFRSLNLYGTDVASLDSRGFDAKFTSYLSRPKDNALMQNFPNPFNPETWIPYQLNEGCDVKVKIHNSSGALVRELILGHKPAGLYLSRDRAAYWDGKNEAGESVSSGIYFYTIQAGDFTAIKKMAIRN